ncbi:MAG: nucleoside diphosphate kinase regulator [Sulfuricella sp.]|nr:nucleoside diphosphate kinase regulator [Sulfuricella sp.]
MATLPHIIVSNLDFTRLSSLLNSPSASSLPELDNLREELGRADVVEPEEIPPTVATMNSTIKFVIEPTGKEFELTLSYPDDVQGQSGRISVLAPVGSALLGLSVGQEIEWPVPGGKKIHVRVLEIGYQPERAGEFTR